MHIALFGGSFDPPHLGHTKMVKTVLDQGLFDEVWFVPVFQHQPQFAKNQMSNWEDRLNMLKLMKNGKIKICEFEKKSGQQSYTHLALRKLSQQYPQHKFSWLMGSDQLPTLKDWKCDLHEACFPQCADEFGYYVYPRVGFPMVLPYANLKAIPDVEPMDISSTEIRQLVKEGKSIKNLVNQEVADYIKQRGLYVEN